MKGKDKNNVSMKKKTKLSKTRLYLIIAVIVLSVLVVGLSGYIFYDKYLGDYFRYRNCEGCNPNDPVPVKAFDPIGEMERKLNTIVPVLNEEIDDYSVFNKGWPYNGFVAFNREAHIDMAKDFKELSVYNREYSSVEKKTVKSLDVSIYFDSAELIPTKSAVWKYDGIYYAFTLDEASSLDFDKCVEDLISQVIDEE